MGNDMARDGEKTRVVGPYSGPEALAKLDRRTRESRLLEKVRAELTAHVGGAPSATQHALIERAAWLSLRVAQIEKRIAADDAITEHDSRTYLAWSNSLQRALRDLGMKGSEEKVPPLAELFSESSAA